MTCWRPRALCAGALSGRSGNSTGTRRDAVVSRVRWRCTDDRPPNVRELGRETIAQRVAQWCGPEAAVDDDLTALHALRIRGKRLRYAMELFAGVFSAGFRDPLYVSVEQAQELLGRV